MINLQKGNKINLHKEILHKVNGDLTFGLGWDESCTGSSIDCDATAIMLLDGDKVYRDECLIYYGNLKNKTQCIQHCGDNLVGGKNRDGLTDSEQLIVRLDRVPQSVRKIRLVVNIYRAHDKGQHFGMIGNAYIRLFETTNPSETLLRYNLTENYAGKTAIHVAELSRNSAGEWEFEALGNATREGDISEIVGHYREISRINAPADLFEVGAPLEQQTSGFKKFLKALFG